MDGPAGASATNEEHEDTARSLIGRMWTLRTVAGAPVTTLHPPSLRFEADGRITGSTGVNRMFGDYEIADGRLDVINVGSTLMAGPPEAMTLEADVLRTLTGGGPITVDDGVLTIGAGDHQLTFDAAVVHS